MTNPKAVGPKHLNSRICFLHQATKYMASIALDEVGVNAEDDASSTRKSVNRQIPATSPSRQDRINTEAQRLACGYARQMRAVAKKTTIRLAREVKRSLCKRCNTLLHPGTTSHQYLDNPSRGGRKSHAEVLVIRCQVCSTIKRFPSGTRQVRRSDRLNRASSSSDKVTRREE